MSLHYQSSDRQGVDMLGKWPAVRAVLAGMNACMRQLLVTGKHGSP